MDEDASHIQYITILTLSQKPSTRLFLPLPFIAIFTVPWFSLFIKKRENNIKTVIHFPAGPNSISTKHTDWMTSIKRNEWWRRVRWNRRTSRFQGSIGSASVGKKLMGSYITHARAINTHTRTRIKGEKEIERESEIEKEHFLASYRSGWWRKVIPAKPTSEEEEETKVVGKIYFGCCSSLGEALCTQPRRKKESCVCDVTIGFLRRLLDIDSCDLSRYTSRAILEGRRRKESHAKRGLTRPIRFPLLFRHPAAHDGRGGRSLRCCHGNELLDEQCADWRQKKKKNKSVHPPTGGCWKEKRKETH